jgi:hypothetical protein
VESHLAALYRKLGISRRDPLRDLGAGLAAALSPASPVLTAWHWVDPVAGAAKAAAVLRPGGVLAPFGHVFQLPPAVAAALAAAYRRVAPDSPIARGDRPTGSILDAYRGLYARAADGIREAGRTGSPR